MTTKFYTIICTLFFMALLSQSNAASKQKQDAIKLNWKAHPNARSYHVKAWQIVSGSKSVVLDQVTRKNSIRLPLKSLDTVFWQIAIIDKSGKEGSFSDPATINPRAN